MTTLETLTDRIDKLEEALRNLLDAIGGKDPQPLALAQQKEKKVLKSES